MNFLQRRSAVWLSVVTLLAAPALAAPASLQTFIAQSQPAPDASISYGPAPVQAIDLFLPKSPGPHPVVVLIHGGCWTKSTAGRQQLRALGSELARRGVAVWSIGYRRVDEDGGAYPGIFQDVGKAIDLLPANAAKYDLDTSRVVAVGHSAGAHLALWAASRGTLPPSSPTYVPTPFPIHRVVALGGVGDIGQATGLRDVCGPGIIPALLGQPSAARPDVYSDTSPAKLLPNGATIVMITGADDALTPPAYAQTYVDEVRAAGGSAELVIVPDAAHFDVVTIGTPAWRLVSDRIVAALGDQGAGSQ
jgi:acetyl esterase/lipase